MMYINIAFSAIGAECPAHISTRTVVRLQYRGMIWASSRFYVFFAGKARI